MVEAMSAPRVVGLCGFSSAGKDTVAAWLVGYRGYTRIGFADALKATLLATDPLIPLYTPLDAKRPVTVRLSELVRRIGWEDAKRRYPEIRFLLQRLGTEGVRRHVADDTWLQVVRSKVVAEPGVRWVIPDVRFDNEADMVRELGGEVWWIDRTDVGPLNGHASEVLPEWDVKVPNDGDLDALHDVIAEAMADA